MLKGLCDAYSMEQDDSFLKLAISNAEWIVDEQIKNNT